MKNTLLTIIMIVLILLVFNGCNSKSVNKHVQPDKKNTNQISTPKEGTLKGQAPTTSPVVTPAVTPATNKEVVVPILTYHSISYEKGNTIRLPVEKFREQMKWLKDNNYTSISLDDLINHYTKKTSLPEKPVIITFDDGYRDNYEAAFPVLKEFGMKAIIYVITNTIDKSPGYLTAQQIKELDANGISIGSHTNKHEELDKLSFEAQLDTIKQSREKLEKLLGKRVRHFAYPVGLYNKDTLKALKQEGLVTAVTMNRGWAKKNNGPLTLSRVFISSDFDIGVFRKRLTNPGYKVVLGGTGNTTVQASPRSAAKVETPQQKQKRLDELYTQGYNLFIKQGKYQEAISIQNSVLKEDPNHYKAYSVKGIAECFAGDFKNGMRDIDKALELKPEYGYGRFNKALAYELYGSFDESLLWYDKALEVEEYVWSYYGKASIYGRKGDTANTVLYLKKAFAYGDFVKNEAKTEKDFDPVRNTSEFKALFN